MVSFNLKSLMWKKAYKENNKVTYQHIKDVTGISIQTLSRINSTPNYTISAENLEKLCNYFNCTPNDLISIYPDENPE